MIETLPIDWLFIQEVPLFFFLVALLTRPTTWAKRTTQLVETYLPRGEENESAE